MDIDLNDKKGRQRGCGIAAVIFIAIAGLLYTFGGSSDPLRDCGFTQVAYFKSDTRARVFVYTVSNATPDQMEAHAAKQMHTMGKPTVVFYYSAATTDNFNIVSVSATMEAAIDRAARDECIAMYFRYTDGRAHFTKNPYKK